MMKKVYVSLSLLLAPLLGAGQIYHAGESAPTVSSVKHWEASLGWQTSGQSVQGRLGERLFDSADGLSLRGLYYPTAWLGVGLEGVWFDKKDFPVENTYKDVRYGVISKWVLTPQTKPAVYLLLGAGLRKQRTSYMHTVNNTANTGYGLTGLGLELDIYRGIFIQAEGQALYNTRRKVDNFTQLAHRLELSVALRGGVRF
ncbi:MAG: hypothetical protein J6V32_02055 [Elusimicrobiaceae bacterium]|nr:hypothetical protein [Elusimicrobiaceae bacterium]